MSRRLAILLAALAASAGIGVISIRHAERQSATLDACGAVETGDWNTALEKTESLERGDAAARSAFECRCLALIATQRGNECEALMDELLSDPGAASWSPGPQLAIHLIQLRREAGRIEDAADLARRAALRHPDDGDLFFLELTTRASVEDELSVLRELEARIDPDAAEATRMRTSLATRHLIRGDARSALASLGPGPPSGKRNAVERWYDTRGMALAHVADVHAVRDNYAEWERAGGQPMELRARYALTLSIAGLSDPDASSIELLASALAETDGFLDEKLLEALAIRLILTLVDSDRQSEAIAIYDRYRDRFEFAGLTREELERSVIHSALERGAPGRLRGGVHFSLPTPDPNHALWVSPLPGESVDADFVALDRFAASEVELERPIGVAPLRWVYRNPAGDAIASGTVNLRPDSVASVAIEARPAREARTFAPTRKAADGRRRVLLLLLDCGDWRIVQYLRARGELPVIDALIAQGQHGVLDSDPPLTAAALESIVWPERRGGASFLGLVHQLGVEVAGLASVGENPFRALSWVLPEDEDLFSVIGSLEHSAANMLFSHGGIRAGAHSEITGPRSERRRLPIATSARDLNADERARWPALATRSETDAFHLRTIAAELDTAAEIAQQGEIDFLALRVESLDILTHAHFAHTTRTGQDDADGLLYELYRYIDARLGEIHDLLDADDILIVMSDHGIRTAMEHSRDAMFVAAGGGVPHGRIEGRPALRGVSAAVADLMGVDASWPRTGVAPWAQPAALHSEAPAEDDRG